MSIVNKKIRLKLVGIDGNIFAIMGAFSAAARKQKWTKQEINTVLNACMDCDAYDKALAIIIDHCENPSVD